MKRDQDLSSRDGRALSVTVTDIAMPGDAGVAKAGDLVVFVPGTIPGDRVAIRIVKREKRYGHGEVVAIEKPSLFRVEPACPHFGACGGCTIQSMDYARQLEMKASHLKESLKRIGRLDVAEDRFEEITPSPQAYFYRSKIELAFGYKGNEVIAGMRGGTTTGGPVRSAVLPVPGCKIFSDGLQRILEVVEDHIHGEGLFPYNEQAKKGTLRHLVLREAKATGHIMVIVETKGAEDHGMGELYRRLTEKTPRISSLWRAINDRPGSYIDYSRLSHEGGERYLDESLAGLTLRIYPASFFQPNPAGAALIYERVGRIAAELKAGNVLGLYCGMAPMELVLSRYSQNVIGIDSSRANIENARENALLNGINNCSFLAGRVEDIVTDRSLRKPELVVTDPPRSGISPRGIDLITSLAPKTLIYVSCNPATLARDLGRLAAAGYAVELVAPFDLFPHTSHLETLTVLTKRR
ncbi:MAG: 23S rRNA (uracil-C(5))-methyltransferase RlmCD [Syntrophorhabdus sp. PtaB.Bin047]|jgi:23S rRNA (uracil-5-)-methyltransferase RumA|nr:MAG: 23S rRNA (uracil-C(5))-methyltransferase RlmCD [Syntrophorhabdus sp. PtaB.Bin047]